jgi:hypothetical protein
LSLSLPRFGAKSHRRPVPSCASNAGWQTSLVEARISKGALRWGFARQRPFVECGTRWAADDCNGRTLAHRPDCTNDRCTLEAAVDYALRRSTVLGRVLPIAALRGSSCVAHCMRRHPATYGRWPALSRGHSNVGYARRPDCRGRTRSCLSTTTTREGGELSSVKPARGHHRQR